MCSSIGKTRFFKEIPEIKKSSEPWPRMVRAGLKKEKIA
jgi:hypothetical protein